MGNMFDLKGKVAIVTGGSDGIGKEIAFALAEAGAYVVVAARSEDKMNLTVKELNKIGPKAIGVKTDVTSAIAVDNLAQTTKDTYGQIDILINNAGGSKSPTFNRDPFLELTEQDMDGAFDLNVKSVFLCSKAVVPFMEEQGKGSIINIASISGVEAFENYGFYGSTKSAVINLTGNMAVEWAPDVRVNCILPGHIDTPRTAKLRSKERLEKHLSKIALGRMGTPADIAGGVIYLASDAAKWTNGTVLRIDGGRKY